MVSVRAHAGQRIYRSQGLHPAELFGGGSLCDALLVEVHIKVIIFWVVTVLRTSSISTSPVSSCSHKVNEY